MTNPEQETAKQDQLTPIKWEDFLANVPPGKEKNIINLMVRGIAGEQSYIRDVSEPEIQIYCDDNACKKLMYFKCEYCFQTDEQYLGQWHERIFYYRCKNCEFTQKIIVARIQTNDKTPDGKAMKIGEWPPFGPHVPPKVITIIGPDRDLFLMGRRAESQSMGIGAFAYYRRVVENQKNRILDEIIRVSIKINAPAETIEKIESAKKETHFSKSIDLIKDAMPPTLLIDGNQNPMTLLYKALSQGLHSKSDEECLESAKSIRVVLTDLSERIAMALKENADLKDAVSQLNKTISN